jgi:hypothetical protein
MRDAEPQDFPHERELGAGSAKPPPERFAVTDYWLSKLCYDLQDPGLAADYRADRASVLDRYPLSADVRGALLADDVARLAGRVNAYLLRFYFGAAGMSDAEFVRRLRAIGG